MTRRQNKADTPLNLNHAIYGDDGLPRLLVLHGLFGSATNWRGIIRTLESEFQVIAVDLRNHGGSPWHSEMGYSAMAEDVAWLIEDHGFENPTVLGHSMGGKVAMAMAQMALTTINKLVVADIAPVPYQHSHLGYINTMQAVNLSGVTTRGQVDAALAEDIPEPGIRQFLLQNLVREDGSYRWRINLEAIRDNMNQLLDYPDLPPSDIETLFIGGQMSNYITDDIHAEIVRQFPAASIEFVAGAGHWLHAEQPQRVVELVRKFLN